MTLRKTHDKEQQQQQQQKEKGVAYLLQHASLSVGAVQLPGSLQEARGETLA